MPSRLIHGPILRTVAVAYCWVGMVSSVPQASMAASESRRSAVVKAVESAKPAVVNIDGQKTLQSDSMLSEERRVHGMGTGLIIDERGYILTNYHVVEGVRSIQVSLDDGAQYVAKSIARDDTTDLAIIKIDAGRPLKTCKMGVSSDLMEGEEVIAVGNPFGYSHSVTLGIISALHRNVRVSDTQEYMDLIQTDASINPGNSGGPLLNIDGEVIGVNVAVRAGAHGIGFAIPIDKALAVASELMSVERLEQHWHGLHVQSDSEKQGVRVMYVEEKSPAAQAGLEPGDVLCTIEKLDIRNTLDLERALLGRRLGSEVQLVVKRSGETKNQGMKLAALDTSNREQGDRLWRELGIRFRAVSGGEFKQSETEYGGGLLVASVRKDGPAYRDGLRTGDVLVGLHVWETMSLEHIEYILKSDELPETPVKYYIVRDSEPFYGRITIAKANSAASSSRVASGNAPKTRQ